MHFRCGEAKRQGGCRFFASMGCHQRVAARCLLTAGFRWCDFIGACQAVDSVVSESDSGHLFAPRRPTLMGPKWAKPQAPVGSACGGFLRPDTDPAVAATGHPWPGAAQSASMPIAPRISARTQPAPCVAFCGVAAIVGEKRCLFSGLLGWAFFDLVEKAL